MVMDWVEFARKMAEAGRAKVAEDLKRLEQIRSQLDKKIQQVPAHSR